MEAGAMVERLSYEEMVQYVDNVLRPQDRGFTSEEINDQLFTFCANCPDPVAALDIVIETMGPVTARELVDRALNQPPRDPATLPESELALTHPLRSIKPQVS
jgi:hypothetical protein